jgi:hypothetical protein
MTNEYGLMAPNFDAMHQDFYLNLDKCMSVTMMWATYYSRLNMHEKEALLKKHYIPASYGTFFRLAKQLKSLSLLKWLQVQ